jgi:glycosyltransferase involved in cell wall biosynthesis
MIGVLLLPAAFLLVCVAYPIWLLLQPARGEYAKTGTDQCGGVSLIIPCYNEADRIGDKITSLLQELACFDTYELLVIDNCSTDGTREALKEFKDHPRIRVILKESQLGIPHSMNMGVQLARYEQLVFSDVRQRLTCNTLRRLVAPLADPGVGAVSACLAARTGEHSFSILRRYENFLKRLESRTGNLIGVYGPLYAIRRECYRPIPEHIILDDLYNGLNILAQKKVVMVEECQVIDEDFSMLYDYRRSRRYLLGFLQILREPALLGRLSTRQRIMLFWHKYLRLLLPLLFFGGYVATGLYGLAHPGYLALFAVLTLLWLLALWPALNRFDLKPRELLRVLIFYVGAAFDLLVHRSLSRRFQ